VLAGLEEPGDALGHVRASVAFDAERHAGRVAREQVAEPIGPRSRGIETTPPSRRPGLFVLTAEADDLDRVPGLQVRQHRRRLDRPAAAGLAELARRQEQDPHSAGPIEQGEDREDDGRPQDPRKPPGLERNRHSHSSPSVRKARGARRLEPAHMSNAPPTPIMMRTDGNASAWRSIHRSCLGAPSPTRTIVGAAERITSTVSSSRAMERAIPSSSIATPAPATTTFSPGRARHRARRALGDVGRAADERHGLGALGGQAQQHRRDLHSGPPPDRAAAP
jgi:hypothetical protein